MQEFLEKLILEVADGKKSVSRIKRILEGLGHQITLQEIRKFCEQWAIATPKGQNNVDRPDIWSFLLEARSFWKKARRYWGDAKVKMLSQQMNNLENFKNLYPQFALYSSASIYDRQDLDFDKQFEDMGIDNFDPIDVQNMYFRALSIEFDLNPDYQEGVKFPLATKEYEEYKNKKYIQDCIEVAQKHFETDQDVINFFSDFWKEIQENRGVFFCNRLERLLLDKSEGYYPKTPYYGINEAHFRRFLSGIPGLANNYPAYLTDDRPICMKLEGLIHKYGWGKLHSLCLIGCFIKSKHNPN